MKYAEEIMDMLGALDLTGSLRDAGELPGSGVTPLPAMSPPESLVLLIAGWSGRS